MKPASDTKVASATVYLMEELGDARMRCDQLLRYVDKAVKVIEKSSHKDHFFEVAGDLIRGIPETVFKLHKALEAVALAANRIDYEEIKQDLRPEKVEELERVLKDVRVRQVQRRSQPMVNPASVVEQLKSLAKKAREGGALDTEGLATLIASLELGAPKVADDAGAKVASQLEAMSHALENPPEGETPSRYRLAQVLRRTLGEQLDVRTAAKPPEAAAEEVLNAVEALKKIARGSGNPKLLLISALSDLALAVKKMGQDEMISNLLDRTASVVKSKWSSKELADAGKGEEPKTASEDEKRSRFEEGKPADPTKHMDPEDAKAWKENTDEYGDKFKKEAAKPSEGASLELNTVIYGVKQLLRGTGNAKRTLFSVVTSLSNAASHMGQDERITNALWKAAMVINQSFSAADMREYSDAKAVMAAEDEKLSRFEEGKPADPTKDMDPEDAKAWKENTDKYQDKFKKEAAVEDNLPLLNRLVDQVAEAAKQLKHSVGLVERDPRKYQPQVSNIQNTVSGLATLLRAVQRNVFDTRNASEKTADEAAMQKRELKEMGDLLRKAGFDPKDAKKLQAEGMGPEELTTRLKRPAGAVGSLEYTHNLERKSKKASSESAFWKAE